MHTISRTSRPRQNLGFTLTELAIVLAIVSLLIASLMPFLAQQQDLQGNIETDRVMREAGEALSGFAMTNGYLPCPAPVDLSTGGAEAIRVAGACPARVGLLPWATLGVPRQDYWGRHFHYSVTPEFSNSNTKLTLASNGDITVRTRDSGGNLVPLASKAPVVIVSHGRNGVWAVSDAAAVIADTSSTNTDEDTNGNSLQAGYGTAYVSRTASGPNDVVPGGEFDDRVVWISSNVLFNRMVASGKLP